MLAAPSFGAAKDLHLRWCLDAKVMFGVEERWRGVRWTPATPDDHADSVELSKAIEGPRSGAHQPQPNGIWSSQGIETMNLSAFLHMFPTLQGCVL